MSVLEDAARDYVKDIKTEKDDPPALKAQLYTASKYKAEGFIDGATFVGQAIMKKFCGDEPACAVFEYIEQMFGKESQEEGQKNE